MGPLEFGDLPEQALLLIDSAPIIYFLEGHPKFGPRFRPLFEAHAAGRLRFAVTTITIAEVLTGTTEWQHVTVRAALKPNSRSIRIGISLMDAGTGWADQVELRHIAP